MSDKRFIARRGGFTFVDLIVCIVLLLLLIGFVIFPVHWTRGGGNRLICGSNLRQIGEALTAYANANGGQLPRTVYNASTPTPTAFTGAKARDPFAGGGPQPNDVTAAFFLLLRTQDISP